MIPQDVRPPCEKDAELFFAPDREQPRDKHAREAAAKNLCKSCPIQAACLEAALTEEAGVSPQHRHGIRGGLTPRERHGMRDPQRRAAPREHGTVRGARQHYNAKESACHSCREAMNADKRAKRAAA